MLQFFLSHIVYIIAAVAAVLLFFIFSRIHKKKKERQKQREMSAMQRRNEALNETLRNPKVKKTDKGAIAPMEVQWDEKALREPSAESASMMIELIEFSTYSRRKYLFPVGRPITIGSNMDNQLVLPREDVAARHCEIFSQADCLAARSLSDEQTLLIRGKNPAQISRDGVFLNNGDHIRLGSADIQFRCYKA